MILFPNKLKFLLIFATFFLPTNGYKILFLVALPGPSHFLMFKTFINELISRGHEVTSITALPVGLKSENYTEILVDPGYPLTDKFKPSEIFDMKYNSDFENLHLYWWIGLDTSDWTLKDKKVQEFIAREDQHFDLVLAEQFSQEALLMFAHKFKAPIVTLNTNGYNDFFDRAMGALTPWSFVPHFLLLQYGDNMNFFQRSYNFLLSLTDAVLRKYYFMPRMNEIAHRNFQVLPDKGPLPQIEDLEKSISIILVNSHVAINRPRPMMPGLVDIGGSHIKLSGKLPADIQEFLDGAEETGAIYFCLGAFMQASLMPKKTLNDILKVLGGLKQKVLWKYESNDIPNLPPNVMIRKWIPQTDVLAHKNVILFITHGGLFGTLEGSFIGVPMLFVPFFGDQHRNGLNAERQGNGLKLTFSEITEVSLSLKIQEMITNKKYSIRAKEIAEVLNDNPINKMEEAMYWIEYVARHKGAKHLKSAAINLNWFQYLSLDVLTVFLLIIFIIFVVLKKFIRLFQKNKKIVQTNKKIN